MRFPEFLKDNGTIGFVAPSFGCGIEPYKTAFESAQNVFTDKGYKLQLGPNCYENSGIGISNTPKLCGEELTEYYCNDENDVIISCGGGELMCETINFVDFEKIGTEKPKWYMGYSDNTNFTFLLNTLCDTASIYGPCAAAFGMKPWHKSIEDAFSLLQGKSFDGEKKNTLVFKGYDLWEKEKLKDEEHPLEPYNVTEPVILHKYMGDGKMMGSETNEVDSLSMEGRLIGGCLDCLINLCGTKYDHVSQYNEKYKEDGILWFIESCELNPMSMRRAMWQLEQAGWFKYTKGFIIGRPMMFGQEIMGMNHYKAFYDVISHYKVPIIMDADLGHLAPMVPLVSGSMAKIEAKGNKWQVEMRME